MRDIAARAAQRVVAHSKRYFARRRTLTSVLDRSGYASMHGVILPLAGGRTAFFHHIVRTPSGLLVLESERGEGGIAQRSAAATVPEPRIDDNAVAALDVRIEAVKALAPGVPVFGRFVCTGRAPAAITARVLTLPMLKTTLRMFREHNAAEGVTLDAAWRTLLQRAGRDEPLAAVPAQISSRPAPKSV